MSTPLDLSVREMMLLWVLMQGFTESWRAERLEKEPDHKFEEDTPALLRWAIGVVVDERDQTEQEVDDTAARLEARGLIKIFPTGYALTIEGMEAGRAALDAFVMSARSGQFGQA